MFYRLQTAHFIERMVLTFFKPVVRVLHVANVLEKKIEKNLRKINPQKDENIQPLRQKSPRSA